VTCIKCTRLYRWSLLSAAFSIITLHPGCPPPSAHYTFSANLSLEQTEVWLRPCLLHSNLASPLYATVSVYSNLVLYTLPHTHHLHKHARAFSTHCYLFTCHAFLPAPFTSTLTNSLLPASLTALPCSATSTKRCHETLPFLGTCTCILRDGRDVAHVPRSITTMLIHHKMVLYSYSGGGRSAGSPARG